jgi:hypothetical protein
MNFRSSPFEEKINLPGSQNGELAENSARPEQGALDGPVTGSGWRRQALDTRTVLFQRNCIGIDTLCPNGRVKVAKGHAAHEKHAVPPVAGDHETLTAVNKIMTELRQLSIVYGVGRV